MTNKLNIIILILFVIIISDCSTVLIDHGKIGYLEPNKNDIDSKLIIANKCFSIFDTIIIKHIPRKENNIADNVARKAYELKKNFVTEYF
jgi:hypothetical protein